MIGKKLAQVFWSTVTNLAPCPFTIVTSIGRVEQATGYTRKPLQLSFQVKLEIHPHLFLSCDRCDDRCNQL